MQLLYNISANLKNEYDGFIKNRYGHKRNRCGYELEKAIKLYLTLNGHAEYVDDHEIKAMLDVLRGGDVCTHTV